MADHVRRHGYTYDGSHDRVSRRAPTIKTNSCADERMKAEIEAEDLAKWWRYNPGDEK